MIHDGQNILTKVSCVNICVVFVLDYLIFSILSYNSTKEKNNVIRNCLRFNMCNVKRINYLYGRLIYQLNVFVDMT